MKRILLLCSFVVLNGSVLYAQSGNTQSAAQTTSETLAYTKQHLSSALIELDAAVSRENKAAMDKSISSIMQILVHFMGQTQKELQGASEGTNTEAAQQTIDLQNRLYSEIKMLSIDPKKNYNELKDKVAAFQNTLASK